MKVGIDVSQAAFGSGVSDYTTNIIENLPCQSMSPFGFSWRSRSKLRQLIPNTKVLTMPLSVAEQLGNVIHKINIESFFGKMDIYHSSDWIQFPSHAKKVTTVHDLSPMRYPNEISPKVVSVHTKKMKLSVSECDHFICVSKATANDLMKIYDIPYSKISVIYEALPERFKIVPNKYSESNYVVAMGSTQPRKNIARLVSAYKKYKSTLQLPEKLIIIGENALLSTDPDVIFTGYISDQQVVDIVAGAETFVYPSIYEGFGLPALISFYHKTPFVAANTSSLPEVVGDAGVLVDPLSEKAIAEGISVAIKNHKNLISAGEQQLKKFSWKTAGNQTIEVYKLLLSL